MFSNEFWEIFQNSFLTEKLRATVYVNMFTVINKNIVATLSS